MIYKKVPASNHLSTFITCFWMVDSEGKTAIQKEKIVPDGYPEMIFHYGDPYRANISGDWYTQDKYLIAGQITNHFFLENTGTSGMIGIKFQPWALKHSFNMDMEAIVNRVIPLPEQLIKELIPIIQIADSHLRFDEKVRQLEDRFIERITPTDHQNDHFQKAVELIIATKGSKPLQEIRQQTHISERSMERYFKKYIGLSPKLYSRIIRFSNIFHLIQSKDFEWTEISFLSGFYDQSHFIKNFKEFTGEDPTSYGFDEKNMANLFLKPN